MGRAGLEPGNQEGTRRACRAFVCKVTTPGSHDILGDVFEPIQGSAPFTSLSVADALTSLLVAGALTSLSTADGGALLPLVSLLYLRCLLPSRHRSIVNSSF